VINGGAAYTKVANVSLHITASEPIYQFYASEQNAAPAADAPGWHNFSSPYEFFFDVQGTPGKENKTVYVWLKDYAGNVSSMMSGSIILDKKPPELLIDSPASTMAHINSINGRVRDVVAGPNGSTIAGGSGIKDIKARISKSNDGSVPAYSMQNYSRLYWKGGNV
jgi:hypothetical protein